MVRLNSQGYTVKLKCKTNRTYIKGTSSLKVRIKLVNTNILILRKIKHGIVLEHNCNYINHRKRVKYEVIIEQ